MRAGCPPPGLPWPVFAAHGSRSMEVFVIGFFDGREPGGCGMARRHNYMGGLIAKLFVIPPKLRQLAAQRLVE